jgi:hypothetical protein
MKDSVNRVLMASHDSIGQQINAGNDEYAFIKDESPHVLTVPLIRKHPI